MTVKKAGKTRNQTTLPKKVKVFPTNSREFSDEQQTSRTTQSTLPQAVLSQADQQDDQEQMLVRMPMYQRKTHALLIEAQRQMLTALTKCQNSYLLNLTSQKPLQTSPSNANANATVVNINVEQAQKDLACPTPQPVHPCIDFTLHDLNTIFRNTGHGTPKKLFEFAVLVNHVYTQAQKCIDQAQTELLTALYEYQEKFIKLQSLDTIELIKNLTHKERAQIGLTGSFDQLDLEDSEQILTLKDKIIRIRSEYK